MIFLCTFHLIGTTAELAHRSSCFVHVRTETDTHHNEVPHASSFGHQCGDAAAAGHQDNLNGLRVEKVIQQLGGLPWVTLQRQNDKRVTQMDRRKGRSIILTRNYLR